MRPEQKSTGWKVPLMFCAAILCLVILASFFRTRPIAPRLPEAILEQAAATHINLDNPEGATWQDAIRNAATGFQPQESKDEKLLKLAEDAIRAGRLDVVCATAIHVKGEKARREILRRIHAEALAKCQTLQWSVFAIHSSDNQEDMDRMGRELLKTWDKCQKTPE